jgi:hypothetical protein
VLVIGPVGRLNGVEMWEYAQFFLDFPIGKNYQKSLEGPTYLTFHDVPCMGTLKKLLTH